MDQHSLITLFPALLLFSISATLTPGPNNILLAYSGANFGIKRTIPHIFGIRLGMISMHIAMLFGLGQLFARFPLLHTTLTVLASGYIVYLAIKIARGKPSAGNAKEQPMSFLEAALFQLVNPKSWAMLITLVSALTLPEEAYWPSAIFGLVVFNLATLPCSFFWVGVGRYLSHFLQQPIYLQRFNYVMASLLLLTIPLIFI